MAKLTVLQRGFTSWSFSRWSDYDLCPLKAKLKHLDKVQEPPNPAMARGAAIGKMAEQYIKGEIGASLPDELKAFAAEFRMMRKQYAKKKNGMVVEDTWAFKKDWSETVWNDWVECWVRIKLDVAHHDSATVLIVTDWKTGKFRPDNVDSYMMQLELYALGALLTYPHIEKVVPRLAYLDAGNFYPAPGEETVFTRADVPRLKKLWAKRVAPMFADTQFAPRPNWSCRFCHYRAANKAGGGGQCKF